MDKINCNGYESMFVFLNEDDFSKHFEVCEACRNEHIRMQKVSNLIKEAKPYIQRNKNKKNILKAACALFIFLSVSLILPYFVSTGSYSDKIAHNSLSNEEIGLPVDEYGFIKVD